MNFFQRKLLAGDASRTPVRFLPLSRIRSMAVIMDTDGTDARECRNDILKFCRQNKIETTFLYLAIDRKAAETDFCPDCTVYSGDVNIFGVPSGEKAGIMLGKTFELMICLSGHENFCVRYLSSAVDAEFKIGSATALEDIYQIVITHEADFSFSKAFKTIVNCLKQIKL